MSKPKISTTLFDRLTKLGVRIDPGDQIVDFGANLGIVSEIFLEKGAVVHAYEPNPYCINYLRRLCRYEKFCLYNEAIAKTAGKHLFTFRINTLKAVFLGARVGR